VWFVGAPVLFGGSGVLVPADTEVVATREADRHITLVFLGRVPEEDVMRFWGSLPQLDLPARTRPLRWERFGRSAIALALADDDGLLSTAAGACHDAAEGLIGVRRPPEHRPHVTMARVPRRSRPPAPQALRAWPVPPGPLDVGLITLFRSRTGATGDRYEVVEQQPRH
jgi:2'-5' RNA ligase